MKRTLKCLSLVLCAALLLSLCACGGEQPSETTAATTAGTTAPAAAEPVTIVTEAESYTVTVDQMVEINASVSGGDGSVKLSYTSADESIATVNKYGKIVGVSAGSTQVEIAAPDGTKKTVSVTVEGPLYENELRLALNVLYNDTALGCSNTETGPYIVIHEDGQYTVSFDCTMDLSESSRMMGVTGLNNLTAVFLYDQAVRDGDQKTSAVTACQIRWDSVAVNGQELTLTNSEFKSAIKTSGIFDTNDPLNAWDGSSVAEVTVDTENHILNINVENPINITVTFTIQGLEFAQ